MRPAEWRFRRVHVRGQLVTLRHVRLWMAAVPRYPGREGSDRWWGYVHNYSVPYKIACSLEAGVFYRDMLQGLMERGSSDRQALRFLRRAIAGVEAMASRC